MMKASAFPNRQELFICGHRTTASVGLCLLFYLSYPANKLTFRMNESGLRSTDTHICLLSYRQK